MLVEEHYLSATYIAVSLRLFCVTGSSTDPTTIPVSHDLVSTNFISMHYS